MRGWLNLGWLPALRKGVTQGDMEGGSMCSGQHRGKQEAKSQCMSIGRTDRGASCRGEPDMEPDPDIEPRHTTHHSDEAGQSLELDPGALK